MQTKEYRTRDKSDWPDGVWKNEPDKIQWKDGKTGLPCLIVRGPSGALCGYVGVDESHPLHGKEYDVLLDVDVHGGLTYSAACSPGGDEAEDICHLPDPGEPDHVWWFGFDCAHAGDFCPQHGDYMRLGNQTYRDVSYVKHDVRSLAETLESLA